MKTSFFIFFYCAFLSLATAQKQNVWKIIAWETSYYQADTSIVKSLEKVFDKKGNEIESNESQIYCYNKYEYDAQNRLVFHEQMCGETNSNGNYSYSYSENGMTEKWENGDTCSVIFRYFFDAKKLKIKELRINNCENKEYNDEKGHFVFQPRAYLKVWKYNAFDSMVSETEFSLPDTLTQYEKLYVYNPKKQKISTHEITYINKAEGKISYQNKVEYAYNADNQIINEKIWNAYENEKLKLNQQIEYEYDSEKRLILKKETYLPTDYAQKTVSTIRYLYQNGELWQTIGESDSYNYIFVYKDGRLIREKHFGNKKLSTVIDYQYIPFEK